MIPTLIILAAIAPNPNELSAAAIADAEQFIVDGKQSPFVFYIVADPTTNGVLRWVLSSTSLQPEIELCLPEQVAPNLYRIDIRNLGWRHEDWREVLNAHPYGGYSLLIRGDWLLTDILDCALSKSQHEDGIPTYDRLLYQGKPPTNEQELLTFWEIDNAKDRHRGTIEGDSQVNRRGRRWIEQRQRHGGYFYITRDSLALRVGSDPLEDPSGRTFTHDGSEAIIGFQKFSSASLEQGTVQFYYLSDGQGKTVHEAPVALVEDSTRFNNKPCITLWGSCLQCHIDPDGKAGIRKIDVNALAELSAKFGIWTLATDPNELASIRRFHLGSLARDISRAQEDYAAGVRLHTGWTPKELIEATESVIRGYDADLTLPKAALELGVSAELLKSRLIEYARLREGKATFGAPVGLLKLVNGGTCSRDLWAQQYTFLDQLVRNAHGGKDNAKPDRKRGVPQTNHRSTSTTPVSAGNSSGQRLRPQSRGNLVPTRRRRF